MNFVTSATNLKLSALSCRLVQVLYGPHFQLTSLEADL